MTRGPTVPMLEQGGTRRLAGTRLSVGWAGMRKRWLLARAGLLWSKHGGAEYLQARSWGSDGRDRVARRQCKVFGRTVGSLRRFGCTLQTSLPSLSVTTISWPVLSAMYCAINRATS